VFVVVVVVAADVVCFVSFEGPSLKKKKAGAFFIWLKQFS